jgi:hypothetical protein
MSIATEMREMLEEAEELVEYRSKKVFDTLQVGLHLHL